MSRTIRHFRPREGIVVLDPLTGEAIPPEGGPVTIKTRDQEIYYQRRIADGDLFEITPPGTSAEREEEE